MTGYFKIILSNKNLKPISKSMIMTTKKAVKKITAKVRLQVAFLFGQRTCRNSSHEPLKYFPIEMNGFRGFFIIAINLLFFNGAVLVSVFFLLLNTFLLLN